MPERPCIRLSQNASRPMPIGETTPTPVTTVRIGLSPALINGLGGESQRFDRKYRLTDATAFRRSPRQRKTVSSGKLSPVACNCRLEAENKGPTCSRSGLSYLKYRQSNKRIEKNGRHTRQRGFTQRTEYSQ